MPWGFKDRETAERLARLVRVPQNIGPAMTRPRTIPRKIGLDNCVLIKTPGGGIPACTGSGPYVHGSATCFIVDDFGNVTADTIVIKNIVNQTIAGNVQGKAERYRSIWVIDVASCGA